jgi:hypothetical protein
MTDPLPKLIVGIYGAVIAVVALVIFVMHYAGSLPTGPVALGLPLSWVDFGSVLTLSSLVAALISRR